MTQALIVILTVLKVLGIVLLSIVGLVLLIVLIVLFCPIRYRLNADLREQEGGEESLASRAEADVRVTWLLHLVRFLFHFPADADGGMITLKVAFITLYPRKKKKEEEAVTPPEDAQPPETQTAQEEEAQTAQEEPVSQEEVAQTAQEEPVLQEEEIQTAHEEPVPEDQDNTQNDAVHDEEIEKPSISEHITELFDKIEAASKKPEVAAKKLYYTISSSYAKIKYVRATIESRCFEHAKQLLLNEVSRVIRSIMPRKTRIYVHYGAGDPAKTADVMSYAGMLYPLFGERLTVVPDFEKEAMDGYARITGRIVLAVPVFSFLRLFLSRDVRRVYRRFKKLKDFDREV